MRSTILCLALAGFTAACASPPPPPPADAPAPEPAPTPPPPPEPPRGPQWQVALFIAGEPSLSVPQATLVALGEDAVAYTATCRERERKAAEDPGAWSTAQGAPVCLIVRFVPPTPLGNDAGVELVAAELLMPLGAPRWDGVVLARSGPEPWSALVSGDPALLDGLRAKVAGALSTAIVARR